ncbi:MAG: GC-type dockerin domain-anchored protein [Phycisphaerales bacterium JB037]
MIRRSALMLAATAGAAFAQTATFQTTGSAPGGFDQSQAWGVSDDGGTVVGWTGAEVNGQTDIFGFRIVGGVPTLLTEIVSRDIYGVSGDTTVIAGQAYIERPDDPGNFDAAAWVWVEGQGMTNIFSDFPNELAVARGVSGDGGTTVGMTNFYKDFVGGGLEISDAFAWSPTTGQRLLPHLPFQERNEAMAVNADGSVIVGYEQDLLTDERTAVRWDAANGDAVSTMPAVPGSLGSDIPTAISANGRFAAGFSLQFTDDAGPFREDAVLWDLQSGTAMVLGPTPSGFPGAVPSFVADDGQTVIGTWNSTPFFDLPEGEAFIWTASGGMQSLEDWLLAEHGLAIPDWELRAARDASPDLSAIVGHALSADRSTMYGFVVRLGVSVCRADLTGSSDPNDPTYGQPDGDADGDDFFFYLDAFTTGNLPVCDLTGSSDPNDPSFDVPDRDCDGDDFFRYLDLFVTPCS